VHRFVLSSFDEVYGSLGPKDEFTSESLYDCHSPYAASKVAADHLARAWFYPMDCREWSRIVAIPEKTHHSDSLNPLRKPVSYLFIVTATTCAIESIWTTTSLERVSELGRPGQTYSNWRSPCATQHRCRSLHLHGSGISARGYGCLIQLVADRPGCCARNRQMVPHQPQLVRGYERGISARPPRSC